MKRGTLLLAALGALIVLAIATVVSTMLTDREARQPYAVPAQGVRTFFASPQPRERILTIEAATDVSFMRDFILAFQRAHPRVAVLYVDMLSSELLEHALRDCRAADAMPDLFLSISSDHLIELANRGCAAAVPSTIAAQAHAQWRHEVMAFSLEPAVFIYNTRLLPRASVPHGHVALVEEMRADPAAWLGRIGTYDIEQSGTGYSYASTDARQAATYGRLIESFGRSKVRTYCCSNEMVDAVASGQIMFGYNVQLSYAYAGQRAHLPIGVVMPDDFQVVAPRSVMVTRTARNPTDATAFVQTLLSPSGRRLADALIAPPKGSVTVGTIDATNTAPLVLNSSLLSLRDQARRSRFIYEWRRAVRPPEATPVTPASAR